jgi:hypothetical protein
MDMDMEIDMDMDIDMDIDIEVDDYPTGDISIDISASMSVSVSLFMFFFHNVCVKFSILMIYFKGQNINCRICGQHLNFQRIFVAQKINGQLLMFFHCLGTTFGCKDTRQRTTFFSAYFHPIKGVNQCK